MHDLLLTLCLISAPDICADRLHPVGAPDCAAARAAAPTIPEGLRVAARTCAPSRPSVLDFNEIAPGVFVHRGKVEDVTPDNLGDVSNIGFVVGDDAVAVIDSGGSAAVGAEIALAVRSRTDLPIRALILTHMHPDHVFGAGPLADMGAQVIGHPKLAQALGARAANYAAGFARLMGRAAFIGTVPPRPEAAGDSVELGGRTLVLDAAPTAHSVADLTVFDPATGTLFAGDLVFDDHAPALDGSLTGWIGVLEGLERPGLRRVIPGHGGPVLSWPDGGAPLLRYLRGLRDETRAALADGLTIREAAATVGRAEAEAWALFDLFHPRNATAAYAELEWE